MKRLYQKEWHGIPFASFTRMSAETMADASFYETFYKVFFEKYRNWQDLDPEWLQAKSQVSDLLRKNEKCKKENRILSIGCGLGVIEKPFFDEGFNRLEITEVTKESLRWILPYVAAENVHIGFFPDCLSDNRRFDFIYLAGIETFFDRRQLIDCLRDVAARLNSDGSCLIVSWAILSSKPLALFTHSLKEGVKSFLHKAGILPRGQFWGYLRSRRELRDAVASAGFSITAEGELEKKTRWTTYWIELKQQYPHL